MRTHYLKYYLCLLILPLVLTGCATPPPQNTDNICSIFKEKRDWFKASLHMQKKWGVPVQIPMAFIHQESHFRSDALPPRYYALGIIPWGRVSSSKGYSQAQDFTWNEYKKETGNSWASRSNFADSIDFIGWYIDKTHRLNKVSKWDSYNLYLNYHEGLGGYRQKTHLNKKWLLGVANKVKNRASRYGVQYKSCEAELKKPQGFWEHITGV